MATAARVRDDAFARPELRADQSIRAGVKFYPYAFGPEDGVVTLMSSMKFSRLVRGVIPCQVPNAIFWLVAQRRLQTGAEALMLQGVDLADIPNFGIGSHPERFLQDLAGNAFCVYQFIVWLLACLPHVPSTSRSIIDVKDTRFDFF